MRILLAHPGTQHSHLLAQALYKRSALLRYCTSLAFGDGSKLAHWLPAKLVDRRRLSVPASLVHIQPVLEFVERTVRSGGNARDSFLARNLYYQKQIPDHLIEEADALIGFDTSSSVLADRARKAGKKFYVELTTPHPVEKLRIHAILRDRYPEWYMNKTSETLNEVVEEVEVRESFHVSAPSEFVESTYVARGLAADKVTINPYGVEPDQFPMKKYAKGKKIRFLFMGSLAVNKGVPLLLEAWTHVNSDKAELVIAGYGSLPPSVKLPAGVTLMGRIEKSERVALMHSCDVFVCPSFYEGIALVQIESMCCGLPLIGTTASGADGIIEEGREGFIVSSGSASDLAEKMNFFVNYPENIVSMGTQAHSTAVRFTWESYADRWMNLIGMHSSIAR